MLKQELNKGNLLLLCTASIDGYTKNIETDKEFVNKLEKITLEEPNADLCLRILKGAVGTYSEYHRLAVGEPVLVDAIRLAKRYLTEKALPDSAFDLIDRTMALVKTMNDMSAADVAALQTELAHLADQMETKESAQIMTELEWLYYKMTNQISCILLAQLDAEVDFNKLATAQERVDYLKQTLDRLAQLCEPKRTELDSSDLFAVVAKQTGIPLGKVQSKERDRLINAEATLKKRVVGQDHAVKIVLDAVFESRSGLNKKGQPMGSFFFLGPTGTGKTELSKALAAFLFEDESSLIRFDMSEFKEDDFRGKSESEVMSVLEGSSGRMIYWARFACDPNDDRKVNEQLNAKGNKITMIRNHAMISIANPTNEWFVVTGFAVYNTNAFGTVAPYHPELGFDFEWPNSNDPFVTLPLNDAKMSDIVDVSTASSQYIFESENRADDPVSVIVRGHLPGETEADDKYYRVLLLDDAGEQLLIRRNFHYKLNIKGALSFGQKTFEDATKSAATNNVWISISDDVNEVEDQNYILTVEQTSYVLDEEFAGNIYTVNYTVRGKNGTVIQGSDKPEVTWLDDNHVAGPNVGNTFNVVNGVGEGSIQISLLPLGNNEKLEGTLLVKKGRLQRKIKIIVIKDQSFTPTWVGTHVWGDINNDNPTENRAHVTVMFTIPETCPQELFPLRVLVSTNELDVRSEAGVALPVINDGEEGYGEPNGIGYKYVYIADAPGVQRIYFENVLNQAEGNTGHVILEAEHFISVNKPFTYSADQRSITVTGLNEYNAQNPGAENFPEDEVIYYRLVPQKRYANVQFDMQMKDNANNQAINADIKDEFFIYTQHLDYYKDGEESQAGVGEFDCTFWEINQDMWSTGGRVMMFMPKYPGNPTQGTGKYSIYMKTNRAKSAEVVRIASNQTGSPSALPGNGGADYAGNSYRSVTFELANYNPFRFAARVNGQGTDGRTGLSEFTLSMNWNCLK